jgi:iron complex transport system permease protein
VTTARRGVLVALGGVTLLAFVAAVRIGTVGVSLAELLQALRGVGDPTTIAIVRELRLPRALQAALSGIALAGSGATFQALLRNPLADPYVLGVSSGAAVGAAVAVVFGWHVLSLWALPAAAFVGGLLAIALVLRIAVSVSDPLDMKVLLLAGVVVGAFFNAGLLLCLTFADVESFRSALFWMMGSNAGATWPQVGALAGYVFAGTLVLLSLARALNVLALGEQTAATLGISVERTKRIAFATASLLAAAAVAASGVVGFVGLVTPHLARLLWGSDNRLLIPAAALLGATLLLFADTLARIAAAPTELPLGVVTAFIGVPFFIWLLRRRAGHRA